MEIEKLIKHMREEAQDYRSGRTLGRAFADAEDVLDEAATALEQLQAENDRLRRERDAAVEEIPKVCYYCKHRKGWKTCDRFNGNSEAETCTNWQWRGRKEG